MEYGLNLDLGDVHNALKAHTTGAVGAPTLVGDLDLDTVKLAHSDGAMSLDSSMRSNVHNAVADHHAVGDLDHDLAAIATDGDWPVLRSTGKDPRQEKSKSPKHSVSPMRGYTYTAAGPMVGDLTDPMNDGAWAAKGAQWKKQQAPLTTLKPQMTRNDIMSGPIPGDRIHPHADYGEWQKDYWNRAPNPDTLPHGYWRGGGPVRETTRRYPHRAGPKSLAGKLSVDPRFSSKGTRMIDVVSSPLAGDLLELEADKRGIDFGQWPADSPLHPVARSQRLGNREWVWREEETELLAHDVARWRSVFSPAHGAGELSELMRDLDVMERQAQSEQSHTSSEGGKQWKNRLGGPPPLPAGKGKGSRRPSASGESGKGKGKGGKVASSEAGGASADASTWGADADFLAATVPGMPDGPFGPDAEAWYGAHQSHGAHSQNNFVDADIMAMWGNSELHEQHLHQVGKHHNERVKKHHAPQYTLESRHQQGWAQGTKMDQRAAEASTRGKTAVLPAVLAEDLHELSHQDEFPHEGQMDTRFLNAAAGSLPGWLNDNLNSVKRWNNRLSDTMHDELESMALTGEYVLNSQLLRGGEWIADRLPGPNGEGECRLILGPDDRYMLVAIHSKWTYSTRAVKMVTKQICEEGHWSPNVEKGFTLYPEETRVNKTISKPTLEEARLVAELTKLGAQLATHSVQRWAQLKPFRHADAIEPPKKRVFPDEFGWVKKWVLGDEVGSRNEAERGAWLMTEDVVIHQWGETCMDDWSYHALPFKILVDLLDSTKIVGMKAHHEQRALGQLEQLDLMKIHIREALANDPEDLSFLGLQNFMRSAGFANVTQPQISRCASKEQLLALLKEAEYESRE